MDAAATRRYASLRVLADGLITYIHSFHRHYSYEDANPDPPPPEPVKPPKKKAPRVSEKIGRCMT